MLVAYEDKRFYRHGGVDLLALGRAFRDVVTTGRITSGASTLTMQLARLLHPELNTRSISGKLQQMLLAWHLTISLARAKCWKPISRWRLMAAMLKGSSAASRAWFGKTPDRLTLSEIGLLVLCRRRQRHAALTDILAVPFMRKTGAVAGGEPDRNRTAKTCRVAG